MCFSNISTLKLQSKTYSVLLFFLFYFHGSSSQFTQPSPCRISLAQVGLRPCSLAGRASPPRPPALRPPSSAAWAAPRGRVALSRAGSPLRGRGPGRARAFGAAAACRRLVPGTLEPVVGRPWRPLSERSFPSATFIRATIQLANKAQSSRGRRHWRR